MKSPNNKFSKRRYYLYLASIAFALNWVWEIIQMSAYKSTEGSMIESLFFCTLATVVDAATILAIYSVATFFIDRQEWKFFLATALLGSAFAVLFEKTAFTFGWWSYDEKMPVLPILGTGLLPFVQLIVLAPVSIWMAIKAYGRRVEV